MVKYAILKTMLIEKFYTRNKDTRLLSECHRMFLPYQKRQQKSFFSNYGRNILYYSLSNRVSLFFVQIVL